MKNGYPEAAPHCGKAVDGQVSERFIKSDFLQLLSFWFAFVAFVGPYDDEPGQQHTDVLVERHLEEVSDN